MGADATARAHWARRAARGADLTPAPLLFSERVLSEPFVLSGGARARIGRSWASNPSSQRVKANTIAGDA
ncbi:MAG TPA: hypothetical protein VF526_21760 [Solirubrobacteraceae bacterium]